MKKIFKISGMHCNSCAKMIEGELEDKVEKVSVDFKKGQAIVEFDENEISEKEIKSIIETLGGYKIE